MGHGVLTFDYISTERPQPFSSRVGQTDRHLAKPRSPAPIPIPRSIGCCRSIVCWAAFYSATLLCLVAHYSLIYWGGGGRYLFVVAVAVQESDADLVDFMVETGILRTSRRATAVFQAGDEPPARVPHQRWAPNHAP